MQCNYNSFIQIINFHGLFRNALRCRKTGACRILVPLRYKMCYKIAPIIDPPKIKYLWSGRSFPHEYSSVCMNLRTSYFWPIRFKHFPCALNCEESFYQWRVWRHQDFFFFGGGGVSGWSYVGTILTSNLTKWSSLSIGMSWQAKKKSK